MISRRLFAAMPLHGGVLWKANTRGIQAGTSKVVYHLSDADKVAFVLGNIHNHFAGTASGEIVEIVLVVHGPALKAFNKKQAPIEVKDALAALTDLGLAPLACINTMRAEGIDVTDLLPTFSVAERGAVIKLAQFQQEGFSYIRP